MGRAARARDYYFQASLNGGTRIVVKALWCAMCRHHLHFMGHLERARSEEHTSELQSLMRTSYAVFCLKKKTICPPIHTSVRTYHPPPQLPHPNYTYYHHHTPYSPTKLQ